MHRRVLTWLLAGWLTWGAASLSAARGADRYVAWLADGQRLSSPTLPAWPMPGMPQSLGRAELWNPKQPVRLVRDRSASVALRPPFLMLANGDVLTGTPIELEPDLGRQGMPQTVKVRLEQMGLLAGTGISVRADRIARIVQTAAAAAGPEPPVGTVELTDGRRLLARSIRWRDSGLAILADEGLIEVPFGEIEQAVFPVDRVAAVLDDSDRAAATGGAALARFQLTGGAIITTCRVSRETERTRNRSRMRNWTEPVFHYLVQPAWAGQGLAIAENTIAWCGYRGAGDIPLSLLPAEVVASRRLIGTGGPLLRNRSSDGSLPASGQFETDLGLATHSHSEVVFDLPAGAKSLVTAVGLDQSVGAGGCVRCKVVADDPTGKTLWDSEVLLGSYGPKPTGAIDVRGCRRVVLITEMAHDDRPAHADPLDIRDAVCWLAPFVQVESPTRPLAAALAGIGQWEQSSGKWPAANVFCAWSQIASGWENTLRFPPGSRLELSRKVTISPAGDVLEFSTACPIDLALHDLTLKVDGEPISWHPSVDREHLNYWVKNHYARSRANYDRYESPLLTDRLTYWWDLKAYRGREVTLTLTLGDAGAAGEFVWRELLLRSAVVGLAADAPPPDVPLTSIQPLRAMGPRTGALPLADRVPGEYRPPPIRFLGQVFTGGYGMREASSLEIPLRPEFRRFVAVVGCCGKEVGPLTVSIDGQVHWRRDIVLATMPAEAIDIEIPAGAKTLTLGVQGGPYRAGHAAWVHAGFMTSAADGDSRR
ncbi:MAG: NPCBM/NEW2 domain-containing protein [Pirellulaceae bacterium]|nr:NPCBM/NEW2 domain-containing protein [Pirellulaceae bacterium]